MYEYAATVRRVVDGDTVDVTIDLGFGVVIGWPKPRRVRLAGIDTPETRTRDPREKKFGKLAAARVRELLREGHTYTLVSRSYESGRGKYGRTLVDFRIPGLGSLCEALVRERLAVPYEGQSKAAIRALHEANWAALEGDTA